ncbi:hypothetical protein HPB47_008506 [Ixodes persulcatus]|uniref:Uncharacterized protein n=1 Tax=Ixodes persulcatus TaxID=34615 RepID=A0AC60P4M2_IXOPE|nr:hypothetical protein HPB47_008506 [Ixodes persulcatus]
MGLSTVGSKSELVDRFQAATATPDGFLTGTELDESSLGSTETVSADTLLAPPVGAAGNGSLSDRDEDFLSIPSRASSSAALEADTSHPALGKVRFLAIHTSSLIMVSLRRRPASFSIACVFVVLLVAETFVAAYADFNDMRDLVELLLKNEQESQLSHTMERKGGRSPSLRLRFGRRSDPAWSDTLHRFLAAGNTAGDSGHSAPAA